jgi:transcriptional regulator with XRE-family HTH domain
VQDSSPDNAEIGERVRTRRQEMGLSLRDLAEKTELSATFLSGLERGLVNPTLSSMRRLANALEVPIHRLLMDTSNVGPVVRHDRRARMVFPEGNVQYEILTPQLARKIVMLQVRARPEAGNMIRQPFAERTEECILVQQGMLEVIVAGQYYELEAGDTIYFENRYLDSVRALGDTEAVYVSVLARSD